MFYISILIGFGILFSLSSGITELSPQDKCMAIIGKEVKGSAVKKTLGSIVGIGWNDITNEETLPILAATYDTCQRTPDGDFLIPDGVLVLPIKEQHVDGSSERYDSFSDFKSSNSKGFSVSGGGEFDGFGISGSMSYETKTGKEHMQKYSRTGFSKKLEYHAFTLTATENGGLDKFFIDRLIKVADKISGGNKLLAQHEAETIIRDYGTHVINQALVGAKAIRFGFTVARSQKDKTDFEEKMNAGFDAKFGTVGNAGVKFSTESTQSTETGSSIFRSQIIDIIRGEVSTKGDPNDIKTSAIVNDVVGLKRSGIEIYSLIHAGVLEHHNATTIEIVRELIRNATREHYERNTIPGCTDPTKLNYFYKANVDDGTCKGFKPVKLYQTTIAALTAISEFRLPFYFRGYATEYVKRYGNGRNMPTSGGMFQKCEYVRSSSKINKNLKAGNHCDKYNHANPFTNNYSCPGGFNEIDAGKFYATFKDRVDIAKDEICNSTECAKSYPITDKLLITSRWCKVMSHSEKILSLIQPISSSLNNEVSYVDQGNLITKYMKFDFVKGPYGRPKLVLTPWPAPRRLSNLRSFHLESLEYLKKIMAWIDSRNFKPQTGMFFGGIFENHNVFSENGRCEVGFQEYPFFHNLKICLATQKRQSFLKSVEFGGMISCHDENQACPQGFSKYLATKIDGCAYYYCATVVLGKSFTTLPEAHKPPYIDRKLAESNTRFSHQLEDDEN